MPCYHPITGYKTASGQVVWNELKRHGECSPITVTCGQCIGCKLERSRVWAMRCVHEASLYKHNSSITLTYDPAYLPHRNQLTHKHFQDFMKRMRKENNQIIRYYMGGEYGELNKRPHYHAIIFNKDWADRKYFKTTGSGEKVYTSAELERLWPWGYSGTGDATFEMAAYIARYCLAKRTGKEAEAHYLREDENGIYQQVPEYNKMSNRPGIGADWIKFFQQDVYTDDYVIIRGKESRTPKYYDKIFNRINEETMTRFKEEREWTAYQHRDDNTQERLNVKEQVQQAKLNSLLRGKI